MPRGASLNYEIEMNGKRYVPLSIAEFAPNGEEGRVDCVDGSHKYKIRDGIKTYDEIELVYLVKTSDNHEITDMDEWVESGQSRTINILGYDAGRNIVENWLFEDCELSSGKKSNADRASKAVTTRKYYLLPKEISPGK